MYGGALAGLLLLVLSPLLLHGWPPALGATFLMLPVYMLHQYEEHDHDRFRRFVNETVGQGREALTPLAVFVINVPGVWGVTAVFLWLAARVNPGLGLIAACQALGLGVAVAIHLAIVVHVLRRRRHAPPLATAAAA